MNLTIEIPDTIAAALQAAAQAHGVSAAQYASGVLVNALAFDIKEDSSGQPFDTGYGMWAKFGPAPSAEEIEQNRREMFHFT